MRGKKRRKLFQIKTTTITRIIFLGSIFLSGCTLGGPEFPTGDYIDSEGYITTFHTRGRFWVRSTDVDKVLTTHGDYTLDGEIITFKQNSLCPEGDGIYRWSEDGEHLNFELIEDDCHARLEALSREIIHYKHGE